MAPHEIFDLPGGRGVPSRSSYKAEELVQAVFFLVHIPSKLRQVGVPNLVEHLLSIACDPVTPQDVTPFDKVLVQNLPQRFKTGDILQSLYDSVEIQLRVRHDAGYGSKHPPLHVAQQLAALCRADRRIGKIEVAKEFLGVEEHLEGVGRDAPQGGHHPHEARPVILQQSVQLPAHSGGDGDYDVQAVLKLRGDLRGELVAAGQNLRLQLDL